ncbi:MAG: class Ib ribonucleoside-diphosphate reductase assembly flavoprotein NrdI [Roseibium sp.]|uniref:class Ib ribonucleoside-diphosphate reductase assembly flavoprotein NrdI n=1 Tax=Roseibium sp. TaxID=1936156 RepID=UPI003298FA2E
MSSPDIFYWSSSSRNTERFVEKICANGMMGVRIGPSSRSQIIARPFVLITPTYGDHDGVGAVPKPVVRFLNDPQNRAHLVGVIGGGNRNFGAMFGFGAKVIAQKCEVPVLHRFELAGTPEDVDIVQNGLARFAPLQAPAPSEMALAV